MGWLSNGVVCDDSSTTVTVADLVYALTSWSQATNVVVNSIFARLRINFKTSLLLQ